MNKDFLAFLSSGSLLFLVCIHNKLFFNIKIYLFNFHLFLETSQNKIHFFHERLSCSAMASKKSSVLRYIPSLTFDSPWIQPAKSFVIFPDSTVSTQAFSRAVANRFKSLLLSNLARCSNPKDRILQKHSMK